MNNFKRLLKVYFFLLIYWCVPLKNSVLNIYYLKRLLTKTFKAKKILLKKFEQNIYIILYIL